MAKRIRLVVTTLMPLLFLAGVRYWVSQAEGGGDTTISTKVKLCEVPGYCPVCITDFKTVAYCEVGYSRFCPGGVVTTIAAAPAWHTYDEKVGKLVKDSSSLQSACTQK